jgi:hypothetical protein
MEIEDDLGGERIMTEIDSCTHSTLSSYSPERPLILWTDFPPDMGGGGAVILDDLIAPKERAKIVWISPLPPRKPIEGHFTAQAGSFGRRGGVGRSLFLDNTRFSGDLARETLEIAKQKNARAIWVLMHGAGVSVASRLARTSPLPLHLTVHDDPAFGVALRSRRYLALVPYIENRFRLALKHAKSIDVISESMAERYKRRYGVESSVVHRGLDETIAPSIEYDRSREGLTVGVLGSMYHYHQLPILGRAVADAAIRNGVSPRIVMIGKGFAERFRRDMKGKIEVEITGHIAEEQAIDRLRRCFLVYLNYPFAAIDSVLRQTSFPTKLTTYLKAARPILVHAPAKTSLSPLAQYHDYAYMWNNLDPQSGSEILTRLWNDDRTVESRHERANEVRERFFHPQRNRSELFRMLNNLVEPDSY